MTAKKTLWFVIAALLSAAPAVAADEVSEETLISSAVFADGKLWVRSARGILWSFAETDNDKSQVPFPGPVAALWRQDGHPAVLVCPGFDCSRWALHTLVNGAWQAGPVIASRNDRLVGAGGAGSQTIIATTRRVISISAGEQSDRYLSKPIGGSGIPDNPSVYVTPDNMFVGSNLGEWGGGVVRIDHRTGTVTALDKRSDDLCGGPLNTSCDPVNAIVTEPWNDKCVMVAIGLVHMMAHGRLTQICGDEISRFYFKRLGEPLPN